MEVGSDEEPEQDRNVGNFVNEITETDLTHFYIHVISISSKPPIEQTKSFEFQTKFYRVYLQERTY